MTHPIPAEALKESVAIVGRTGSGKSYAAKGAVELLLGNGARVCIIDPTSIWWGLRSSANGKSPGFPVVVFGGEHADVPIGEASGKALATMLAAQNLPAIVDVSEFTMGGRVRFMTPFLDELYRANRQPLTLVIDEADLFAPQRALPDQTVMLSRMVQICRRGRVRGFRPWLVTQRPAELHKSVLSQANTLIAMQLTAPQDRDAIGAWIEGQADRDEGKKLLAELPKLKKGEGFVWSPSHDVLERVQFPRITTFDSGRTPEEGETLPPVELAGVDLSTISASLREAEKDAAENDPKKLRARIAELEGEAKEPRELSVDALHDAEIAGRRDVIKAMRHALEPLGNSIDNALGAFRAAMTTLSIFDAENGRTDPLPKPPTQPEPKRVAVRDASPAPPSRDSARATVARHNGSGSTPSAFTRRAERMVLAAIAQYPQGRSASQAAIISGYARGGGGFRAAIGYLKTKGFVIGSTSCLKATPEGIAALGDGYEPLPRGRALLEHWLAQMNRAAERRVLETLVEAYPHKLSRAACANRAGYEPGGGGFRAAVGKLRQLELIEGRAELKASAELFS